MSGANKSTAIDALPAPSVWTRFSVSPFTCAVLSMTTKAPFTPTVAVPSTNPSASVTLIVAPASPMPVTALPSGVTVPVGASGAVRSGATRPMEGEALPAASVCATVNGSPSISGGVIATL